MKKFKKLLCMLLVMVMVLSLVACGSTKDDDDDDDKDDKKKTEQSDNSKDDSDKNDDGKTEGTTDVPSDASDLAKALASIAGYTKGEFTFTMGIKGDMEGDKMDMSMGSKGTVDGDNGTAGMTMKMKMEDFNIDMDLADVFVTTKDMVYFDLDALTKALCDVKTSFGALGIPMPEVNGKDELTKDAMKLVVGLVDAATSAKGVEVKQSGDTFTIEVADADTMKEVAKAVVTFVKDNKDAINDYVKKANKTVDVEKYAEKILKYYEEDLKAMGITDEQLSEIKDGISEGAGSVEEVADMFDGLDFDDAIQEIEDTDMEDFASANPKFTFSLTANKDGYDMSLVFTASDDDHDLSVSCDYKFDVKDVTVSAPSNVAKISELYTNVMSDQQLLMNLLTGLQNKLTSWGIDVNDLGSGDDDYNYDYDYDYDYDEDEE